MSKPSCQSCSAGACAGNWLQFTARRLPSASARPADGVVAVERRPSTSDAAMPDNSGNAPADEPIMADGPAAYFSNLPTRAMVKPYGAGFRRCCPCAGTYVCNDVIPLATD